jgi:nitroreductase
MGKGQPTKQPTNAPWEFWTYSEIESHTQTNMDVFVWAVGGGGVRLSAIGFGWGWLSSFRAFVFSRNFLDLLFWHFHLALFPRGNIGKIENNKMIKNWENGEEVSIIFRLF